MKKCWGNNTVSAGYKANNANKVCKSTVKDHLNPQLITAAFERKGKGKVMYSHQQHMKIESRAERVLLLKVKDSSK